MKRIGIAALVAVVCLLPGGPLREAGAGERGRFPGFVYTSPEAIRDAQDALVGLQFLEAGAYTEGEWDEASRRAARDFQRDHHLRPDGRLDRDTMAVLMSHRPRPKEKAR